MTNIGRQEPFPGMPESPRVIPDFGARNSFARAVTPEYWGIDPLDYGDVNDRMMALTSPEHFRKDLIDVPFEVEKSPCASSYFDPQSNSRHNIALTPAEFSLISRGVIHLARHAVNRTLASRPAREDFGTDQAAAQRAGVHITERGHERMAVYRDDTLLPRVQLIGRFIEAADHPGLSRGKEADMRINLGIVHDQIFDDMFVALRQQRKWTPAQENLARRSLDKRLFLQRRSNEHLMHWRNMLAFNQEYLGHKVALFSDRIADSKRYIRQHG